MIEKLRFQPKDTQKQIYRELQNYLLDFFASEHYTDVNRLQLDFQMFKGDECYEDVLQDFIDEHELQLEVGDFKRLAASRWKLCSVCDKPFLSVDYNNKSNTCHNVDYIRYNMTSKRYFEAVGEGYSECEMKKKVQKVMRSQQRAKAC